MIYSLKTNRQVISTLHSALKSSGSLEIKEYKELLERTHSLLLNNALNDEDYNLGLSVICHVASCLPNDKLICRLLYDCIIQSRIFLYDGMVDSQEYEHVNFSNYDYISREYYTLEGSATVLTRDQKILFELFQSKKRIIVSAPTSFGKSRIIQEIIIHNNYKNILIVLPTIALLNETFVRFKSNVNLSTSDYSIYNSLGTKDVKFPETNNIFILTPEKTDLLLDRHPYLKFDFFTMDEIYKIQDEDERSKVFTNCLYRLSKIKDINFYLIGPYFSGFSQKFISKTKSKFQAFSSEIVQKDDYDINAIPLDGRYNINSHDIRKLKNKNLNLRNIINAVDDQSIVYRGQKKYYAELTAKYLIEFKKRTVQSELIEYISENIAKNWTLVKCLRSGIAFHHGALPKYIQTEIIESFNNGELDTIVCTSTNL
jgi:helicase